MISAGYIGLAVVFATHNRKHGVPRLLHHGRGLPSAHRLDCRYPAACASASKQKTEETGDWRGQCMPQAIFRHASASGLPSPCSDPLYDASGVEDEPGGKSSAKITAFLEACGS